MYYYERMFITDLQIGSMECISQQETDDIQQFYIRKYSTLNDNLVNLCEVKK